MTILEKISLQRIEYLRKTGKEPLYVFLGEKDLQELDVAMDMVTFKVGSMEVIAVERSRHVSVGNKYQGD